MDTKEGETWQIRRVGPAASCRKVLNVMKLKLGLNRFGRSPDNDFFLDSKVLKNFISRQHAEIVGERKENGDAEFLLQEKGLNGTFINDVRIKGSSLLHEGDKITFGHTNGYKIEPGQHSQQPHSEFQFVFEKCPRHNGDISNKRGLDSVEYHQTRTCCGNRKLPASPDYDRSECCDNLDKHGALKPSQSPENQEPRVPLHNPPQSWNGKENEVEHAECGPLKTEGTVSYPAQFGPDDKKNTDSQDVPDFMHEVEVLEARDSPKSRPQECLVEADVIEVKHPDECTPVPSIDSSCVTTENHSSHNSDSDCRSCSPSKDVADDSKQRHSSGKEDTDKFRECVDSGPISRTDNEIKKSNGQSNGYNDNFDKSDKKSPVAPKSGSRPSSAKSWSSYDECDGDVNGNRNIWSVISNTRNSFTKDKPILSTVNGEDSHRSSESPINGESNKTSDSPVNDKQDESHDTPPSNKNDVVGRSIFPDNAQEIGLSLKRNQDAETNSMFSEDSDSKSSDTKFTNQSNTAPNKKRKKKRFTPRSKRSKVTSKDDEKLEDGVEWYEVDTCASFDCTKPCDRRVQWVQCDDCDKWFHTVCAGCRYDDVKDSQMEFNCGCL